eukprot:m.188517 g.188517  ORF g.188517 m.188517 type:complete len:138 (+) comp39387_c0_seq3:889-1302(+)
MAQLEDSSEADLLRLHNVPVQVKFERIHEGRDMLLFVDDREDVMEMFKASARDIRKRAPVEGSLWNGLIFIEDEKLAIFLKRYEIKLDPGLKMQVGEFYTMQIKRHSPKKYEKPMDGNDYSAFMKYQVTLGRCEQKP